MEWWRDVTWLFEGEGWQIIWSEALLDIGFFQCQRDVLSWLDDHDDDDDGDGDGDGDDDDDDYDDDDDDDDDDAGAGGGGEEEEEEEDGDDVDVDDWYCKYECEHDNHEKTIWWLRCRGNKSWF